MKTFALCLVTMIACAGVAASSRAFGASISPGKNSAYASTPTGGVVLDSCDSSSLSPLLTATIQKGKKKNVLVVEAMLTISATASTSPARIGMHAFVNGAVEMEPPLVSGANQDCPTPFGDGTCTLTTVWWLDLDAGFVGKPLNVQLIACFPNAERETSTPFAGALVVRMQPK